MGIHEFRTDKGLRTTTLRAAATAIVAAAFATGCVTVSEPPNSSVVVPSAWQNLGAEQKNEKTEDLSRWWEQLGDDTLTQLIDRALDANHDLRLAQSRLREARARRSLAKVDRQPDVSAGLSSTTLRTSGDEVTTDTSTTLSAGFDASWEPDIFGGKTNALRAAEADLAATEADLYATQVSLAGEVAVNYVELRSSQVRLIITGDNLARQSETLQLTEWRALAGLSTELDVAQARVNAEQTRAQMPALESAVEEAKHRLAILVGQPPTALAGILDPPGAIPSLPGIAGVAIPADTLRQRPDVAAAELQLVAATARLDEARAARYPSFKLSGSLSVEGASLSALGGAETVLGTFLGSLTAPIFNRSRIERNIDLQNEAESQALISYEKVVLNALEEVENALVQLDAAQRRETSLKVAAESAEVASALARKYYAAGLESYQTVIDTERTQLTVEDSLALSQADAVTALIRLYKALGGGWTAGEPKEAASSEGEER